MGFYPPDSLVHEAQRRGIRIAPPDANRSRAPLPRRIAAPGPRAARRPAGADRPRLREGGARRGDGGAGGRARTRRALPGDRRTGLALGGRAGEPRKAGLGGGARRHPGRRRRRAARGALAGRRDRGRADERRGDPAGAAARAAGAAGAGAARRVGQADRRLPQHRPDPGTPPAGDAAAGARPEDPPLLRPGDGARQQRRRGRRDGRRPAAAGDRQRDRLHAARGRARDGQPDRAAAGLRPPPGAGAGGAAARREGEAGAPRGRDQRDRDRGLGAGAHREPSRPPALPASPATTRASPARRWSTRGRARLLPRSSASTPSPSSAPSRRPATASAGAAESAFAVSRAIRGLLRTQTAAASSRGRSSPPRRCRRRGRG